MEPSQETQPIAVVPDIVTEKAAPWYKNRALIGAIVLALLVLAGAGWYVYQNKNIVATVNGEKITRAEYDENVRLVKESAAAQGVEATDTAALADIEKQALENLISNKLLIGAAKASGIVIEDADIAKVRADLVTSVGGEEALTARMAEIGFSPEKLESNIRERILVDKYIESVSDIENVTVTDEEIQKFITDNIPADTEGLPPMDQLRPLVEQQIKSAKQQEITEGILDGLRAAAKIDVKI